MFERLPQLASCLNRRLGEENARPDFVISHYWDAAWLGVLWERLDGSRRPHLWVPHSLGILKKANVSAEKWPGLRIEERIGHEREILKSVDAVAPTSPRIHDSLKTDYGFETRLFLPPCVSGGPAR